MKYLMVFRRTILNPFRVPAYLDLGYLKIRQGFNLNNRGRQPMGNGREDVTTLKGLNFQNQIEKVNP